MKLFIIVAFLFSPFFSFSANHVGINKKADQGETRKSGADAITVLPTPEGYTTDKSQAWSIDITFPSHIHPTIRVNIIQHAVRSCYHDNFTSALLTKPVPSVQSPARLKYFFGTVSPTVERLDTQTLKIFCSFSWFKQGQEVIKGVLVYFIKK